MKLSTICALLLPHGHPSVLCEDGRVIQLLLGWQCECPCHETDAEPEAER